MRYEKFHIFQGVVMDVIFYFVTSNAVSILEKSPLYIQSEIYLIICIFHLDIIKFNSIFIK